MSINKQHRNKINTKKTYWLTDAIKPWHQNDQFYSFEKCMDIILNVIGFVLQTQRKISIDAPNWTEITTQEMTFNVTLYLNSNNKHTKKMYWNCF